MLLLPGGISSASGEVRAAFRALLSAERADYKLAVALVNTLVSYLVGRSERACASATRERAAQQPLRAAMIYELL